MAKAKKEPLPQVCECLAADSVAGVKKLTLPCGKGKKRASATGLRVFGGPILWQGLKYLFSGDCESVKCHIRDRCASVFLYLAAYVNEFKEHIREIAAHHGFGESFGNLSVLN